MSERGVFQLRVPDEVLHNLRERLARTRWAESDAVDEWDAGVSPAYLRELVLYWQNGYDWRSAEASINTLPQFTTTIDGVPLHYAHVRSRGSDAIPIVLAHGGPDTYLHFRKLIPMLTDPDSNGGDARDTFDVIVPSLPGFAFSERPEQFGGVYAVGSLIHQLMATELGYERYAAHGSGWGAFVAEQLARDHRDSLIGIHLTEVPNWRATNPPDGLNVEEIAFLERIGEHAQREGSYIQLQGTRPQTLVDALNDSPAGLAAWLVDQVRVLSNCQGDIERHYSKDDLLTTVMLYWLTDSIGTALLPYAEIREAGRGRQLKERAKEWIGASNVPAAFALFPANAHRPPRSWAQRFFNVERWSEMSRGGSLAAHEDPELVAEDIREFFRSFRVQRAIPVL